MPSRIRAAAFVLTGLIMAAPASAQVVQSVQFGGGYFWPKGLDARATGDVLQRDFEGRVLRGAPVVPNEPTPTDALVFHIGEFGSGHFFGEWNLGFGKHIELGFGTGYSRQTVPTIYRDVVDKKTGAEIRQNLRLQMIPVTAVVRFFPFGGPGDVQPYVGAGVGVVHYRYSEFGNFVDTDTLEIFPDQFTATGNAPTGLFLGGIRFPIGGDVYSLSIEGRFVHAVGDTGGIDNGFLDDKIDMSGGLLNVSFHVHF